MKKFLNTALAFAMLAAGCSASTDVPNQGTSNANTDGETLQSEDCFYIYSSDVKTLDYVTTMSRSDNEISENCVDALVEVDRYGNYVPGLAESFEPNEDSTEWTFHLREGVKWVTNSGEHYADLAADDFVAGLQHAADFDSEVISLVSGLIVGLDDYVKGVTKDFSTVGVEAVDEHTLVYHLTKPCTYFDSMANYSILWPINREFLESQGEGCKLGSPNKQACSFGDASDQSKILYNGAYIFAANDAKSKQVLVKNPDYWDAEHVYVNKITNIYDDGSDPSSTVKGFEQEENPYMNAVLLTSSDNFEDYLEQYKDIRFTGEQASSTFGMNFNLNRVTYDHTYKETEKQKEDTKKALLNKNFRLAMKYGLDRVSYIATAVDKSIAAGALRNIECPYVFVKTSDGKAYGDLVAEKSELGVDLSEGQDPFYDPAKSLEYIEKAKAEMPDVEWPIHLDCMVDESGKTLVAQATSMVQSIKESTDGNVIIDLSYVDTDTWLGSAYYSTGPVDDDWDISTSTGWGYDYIDPLSYLHIFSPVDGEVLRTTCGLDFLEDGDATNNAVIEEVGLLEYQKLIEEADAIVDDNDARYEKFAEAEAFLLDNALFIPVNCPSASVNWRLTRSVPFRAGYQSAKFKNVIIRKDPITADEYHAAREEWMKERTK